MEGRPLQVLANYDPGVDAECKPESLPGTGTGITLLIGGTHGDESATVPLLQSFAALHLQNPTLGKVAVLSVLNPDGFARSIRYNARGVDLNRNFEYNWRPQASEPPGAAPLSEPETRALRTFIDIHRPDKIVSLHWALGEIDADGTQSLPLAQALWDSLTEAERKPYRLKSFAEPVAAMTECPGSLGQLCGFGLRYPGGRKPAMVTLELPYDPWSERPAVLPENHFAEVVELWRNDSSRYLEAVEAPVHRMLLTACAHKINDAKEQES